jgi:hypothetical protein
MRFFLITSVLTVILMTGYTPEAQAYQLLGPGQTYQLLGSGAASCGSWTANRRIRNDIALMQVSWVLGFLSGIADIKASTNPLRNMDSDGVAAWIDNYCRQHPIQEILDAAEAFFAAHPR